VENLRPELFADAASLVFAVFFSLTKTETRLFKTLMPWERTSLLFLKGKGIGAVLESLGVSDPGLLRTLGTPDPEPSVEFIRSPDTHSADEEGRLYAPSYLRFVLHPYTKNIFFPGAGLRADLTRILFHAIEEEMTARRNKAFWSPEEIEADAGVREAIQEKTRKPEGAPDVAAFVEHLRSIHARTLAPFARVRDVGDFAAKLIGVLDFIYANSTARPQYFFHPYAEAFMDCLLGLVLKEIADPDTPFDPARVRTGACEDYP